MKLKTPLLIIGAAAVAGVAYKAYDFFSKHDVTLTVNIDDKEELHECECDDESCECHDDECECESDDTCCSSDDGNEEETIEEEALDA